MLVTCPSCGSEQVKFTRSRATKDGLMEFFGVYGFRCECCDHRFRSSIWRLRYVSYAKCPKCHRMDLNKWSMDHYNPPRTTLLALAFGAKPLRCEYCRNNFWSFRMIKERYVLRKRADRSLLISAPAGLPSSPILEGKVIDDRPLEDQPASSYPAAPGASSGQTSFANNDLLDSSLRAPSADRSGGGSAANHPSLNTASRPGFRPDPEKERLAGVGYLQRRSNLEP